MPIRPEQLWIVMYPDPILRKKAAPIAEVTDEVRAVALRMLKLMHEAPGVGLAAPQVGLPWRMFVANATGEAEDDMVFINPTLRDPSDQQELHDEGCLSLPGLTAPIRRPVGITIEATDLEGKRFAMESSELPARIWQHETDHLNGVLILDRMDPIDRRAHQRTLRRWEKEYHGQ